MIETGIRVFRTILLLGGLGLLLGPFSFLFVSNAQMFKIMGIPPDDEIEFAAIAMFVLPANSVVCLLTVLTLVAICDLLLWLSDFERKHTVK